MGQGINLKRVPIDDLKATGIGGSDLFKCGNTARVFLDRENLARAFGQKTTGQTAGAGTDFKDIAFGQISGLTGDLGSQVEIKEKVLTKGFAGGQTMIGDDLTKGRKGVYGCHLSGSCLGMCHAAGHTKGFDEA